MERIPYAAHKGMFQKFAAYCEVQDIEPQSVTVNHFAAYGNYIGKTRPKLKPDSIVRAIRTTWNRICRNHPECGGQRLPRKRLDRWIKSADDLIPETLFIGLQAYIQKSRHPGLFTQNFPNIIAERSIGAAIAAKLLADGARVIIADKQKSTLPNARMVLCDIADEAQTTALIAGIANTETRLDGIICNAGFMIRKPIAELTFAEWNAVLATNLTSTFLLAKAGETLLRAARGSILTIASTRAHMSEPNTESYAASKGGLLALTHALAISLGPDIRVNTISPGWIDTQNTQLKPSDHAQHPAGRVGTVADIAHLAAYLLSPDAGFITGAEFIIDGGMTRKMIYAE